MLFLVFSEKLGLMMLKKCVYIYIYNCVCVCVCAFGANNMVTLINSLCDDISFSTLIHENVNTKPIN